MDKQAYVAKIDVLNKTIDEKNAYIDTLTKHINEQRIKFDIMYAEMLSRGLRLTCYENTNYVIKVLWRLIKKNGKSYMKHNLKFMSRSNPNMQKE